MTSAALPDPPSPIEVTGADLVQLARCLDCPEAGAGEGVLACSRVCRLRPDPRPAPFPRSPLPPPPPSPASPFPPLCRILLWFLLAAVLGVVAVAVE